MYSLWKCFSSIVSGTATSMMRAAPVTELIPKRSMATLLTMHKRNLKFMENPPKKKKSVLDGKPFAKGLILKTVIRKPRKPNSANRKCVIVKLSSGKEMVAFVPGVGHNLQEHQTVLCRVGKLKDTPGVKIRCVRGAYDLPHVKK